MDISYADFKEQTPINAEIDVEGARAVIEQIANPGASHELKDYIDMSLLNSLRAEVFSRRRRGND
jgi:hypothetical protein